MVITTHREQTGVIPGDKKLVEKRKMMPLTSGCHKNWCTAHEVPSLSWKAEEFLKEKGSINKKKTIKRGRWMLTHSRVWSLFLEKEGGAHFWFSVAGTAVLSQPVQLFFMHLVPLLPECRGDTCARRVGKILAKLVSLIRKGSGKHSSRSSNNAMRQDLATAHKQWRPWREQHAVRLLLHLEKFLLLLLLVFWILFCFVFFWRGLAGGAGLNSEPAIDLIVYRNSENFHLAS